VSKNLDRHDEQKRSGYHHAIMHDKFLVADGNTVEAGSSNYTAAAYKRKTENVIVFNDPAVAARYTQEWEKPGPKPRRR
jgi:phosphatidylserine/phosphatidylglycerophosphate/cardiolipin synthase-like enzyme